jgi:hypothetical protein
MEMNMQHGHGQAALTWALTCSMDKDMGMHHELEMQHGHGYTPWTRARSNNTDIQHGHGHEARIWAWICTKDMEIDKHHRCQNAHKKFSTGSLVF